jgi:hypothetical protein
VKEFFVFTLFLIMVIIGSSFTSALALTGSSTIYGSLNVDQDTVSISEFEPTIIQISGTVENPQSGVRLNLVLEKPDGSFDKMETIPNKDGVFSTALFLDANWEKGDYTLQAIYQGQEVGTVYFVVTKTFTPELSVDSTVGTLEIDNGELMKSKDKTVIAKLTGTIKNYERGTPIILTIQKPDTTTDEISVHGKKTGEFTARITIRDGWPLGVYLVNVTYKDKALGTVSFVLNEIEIPSWIKNNARWWSEGTIGDSDFTTGIQYMIKENIMVISGLPEQAAEATQEQVPQWVRNNAGWWANGLISDNDFVSGIKYLVEQGIILA